MNVLTRYSDTIPIGPSDLLLFLTLLSSQIVVQLLYLFLLGSVIIMMLLIPTSVPDEQLSELFFSDKGRDRVNHYRRPDKIGLLLALGPLTILQAATRNHIAVCIPPMILAVN